MYYYCDGVVYKGVWSLHRNIILLLYAQFIHKRTLYNIINHLYLYIVRIKIAGSHTHTHTLVDG